VLSGTGMPTLQALRVLRGQLPIPVVSSNLCLAWALLQTSAPNLAPSQPQDLLAA
jgi:maleate isomerase